MAELDLRKIFSRGKDEAPAGGKILIDDDDVIMMTGKAQAQESGEQEDPDSVVARISRLYDSLSKSQKKIATFALEEYDKTIYMTAAKIAREVGTSESTVVRFAERLGYDGFPEFQEAMQHYVGNRFERVGRVDATYGDSSELEILHSVLNADIENLRDTKVHLDAASFSAAVDTLLKAEHVYIVGVRSCAPLAQILAFHMNLIRGNVTALSTTNPGEIFEQMLHITEKDVLVGISFPRYSMRTLKAMEYANDKNAKVIAITDSVHSPMNLYSSCNLFAQSGLVSIVDSLTAPVSLINALIVAMCMRRADDVKANLKSLESAWDTYQTSRSDEMDYIGDRAFTDDPLWQ